MLIKDLSKELAAKEMSAVHGGNAANAAVPTLIQGLEQANINMVGAGAGSAINNTNTVTGTQDATQFVKQNNGDVFKLDLDFPVLRVPTRLR